MGNLRDERKKLLHGLRKARDSTLTYDIATLETLKEKSEDHVILKGTVPRVPLGQVLTSRSPQLGQVEVAMEASCADKEGHMEGYVWGLGERPKGVKGKLSVVGGTDTGDSVYKQLSEISPDLQRHSLKPEDGPYADKGGLLSLFVDSVFKGVRDDDIFGLIERIIDARPFTGPENENAFPRMFRSEFNFRFAADLKTPDVLPTAGEILSQEIREVQDSVTGAEQFRFVHPAEPYILAVAALRCKSVPAYLAHAVVPGEEEGSEVAHPLIAIVDLTKDVPLMTFDLLRFHPSAGAIDIMSDVAVRGATYAMLAEARVKHLTTEIVMRAKAGKEMERDEFQNQLERIARMLFYSIKDWKANPFIARAMAYLQSDIGDAQLASAVARHEKANGKAIAMQVHDLAVEMLRSGVHPNIIPVGDPLAAAAREAMLDVIQTSLNAASYIQSLIGQRIASAKEE